VQEDPVMTDLISNIAQKANLDNSTVQKGLGALLSTIQKQVPDDTFASISKAIPETGSLLSKFQTGTTKSTEAGGLLNLAGGLLGKDAGALGTLISQFSNAGVSVDTAKAFIPIALNALKERISPETMKQIDAALPGVASLLSGEKNSGGNPLDSLKKLF
jgi:hypothetical protein